jgi:Mrp family chromosome partitioning ATPase
MQGVINAAADAFEWVVIDTPPVALLPDAHVLSAMVDGVVLVIEAAGTQFEDASRAVDTLGRDRILGVVLNRAADGLARIGQYAHYY